MAFSTSISAIRPGAGSIRGRSHARLIKEMSYPGVAFLVLTGREGTEAELRLFQAMSVSVIDHGFVSVTTTTGRYAASGNPNLVPAVAAGLLAAGDNTLSPAASFDLLQAIVADVEGGATPADAVRRRVEAIRAVGGRVPGLGHPTHRDGDYRSAALLELADELGVGGQGVAIYRELQKALQEISGRSFPVNVDGCMAALSYDMGLTRQQAVAVALIGVLPGLLAHVVEEIEFGAPLKFAEGVYENVDGLEG